MRQELAKLQPPVVYDKDRIAASHELDALLDRYRIPAVNIEKMQRGGIERWANEPIHRLLGDIPFQDWDCQLKPELPRNVDGTSATDEIRARATTIIPIVLAAEEMRNKLERALHAAERTPPETLIWALFARLERNERRLSAMAAALDEQVELLNGKIDRVTRAVKRRRK
jgi:hypothetical protein